MGNSSQGERIGRPAIGVDVRAGWTNALYMWRPARSLVVEISLKDNQTRTMKPKIILCLSLVLSGHCQAAIVYPNAPDGGRQMVYENAAQILRTDPRFLGGFRLEELTVTDPYRNYYVGLKDLASGHLLSAARLGDWTYLFIHGTNAVGMGGLIADEKTGKALKANGLGSSNFSNETLEALRIAEQLPQIKKSDYEFRRLDSPGVYFVAVWLHGKSDDIIIPLPNTFGRWNAYQPYSESQMIKLLKPEAKKRLKNPGFD